MSKRKKTYPECTTETGNRVAELRNNSTWKLGWNRRYNRQIFIELIERLNNYDIPENEVDDILQIALVAGMDEGKQR